MSVLVVSGVCQGFSKGGGWVSLLSGVSFGVERGELVGIVGGRLSGKTTLLKIAAGVAVPEKGSVRLGERELTTMRAGKRQRLRGSEIAWLNRAGMSQEFEVSKIVGWLVAGDIGTRAAKRRAIEMLERVGARDCVGQRWPDLSQWQQALVGLAQAFAGSPDLVVVDDLLDALGPRKTEETSRLLRSLIAESEKRCGVLMSASDRDSAVFADREWSLNRDGKLKPTTGHRNTNADILNFPVRESGAKVAGA
jgi:ABC-type lipoprotein export system ATPase subunit